MCVCVWVCVSVGIDLLEENDLTLKETWYLAETIKDANYADDVALLANTSVQAECLLHNLE